MFQMDFGMQFGGGGGGGQQAKHPHPGLQLQQQQQQQQQLQQQQLGQAAKPCEYSLSNDPVPVEY